MKQYQYIYRKYTEIVTEEQKTELEKKRVSGDFVEIPSAPTPPEATIDLGQKDNESLINDELITKRKIKDKAQ